MFEKYKGQNSTGKATIPICTITNNNAIRFNTIAVKDFGITGDKKYCLFYDKGKNLIGIKETDDLISRKFTVHKQNKTATIAVSAFLKFYKIPTNIKRSYKPFMKDGFIVIDCDSSIC